MSKLSPLASVSATREVLEKFGLATKKSFGQHFLINDGVVSRICELAELSERDTVLEVGPGIGTLTIALLQRAGSVVAIERDADLPAVLAETCSDYENFSLIEKDALDLEEQDLSVLNAGKGLAPNKFVANLPYAVAATLILDYFEKLSFLESATIMIQSEVADRICAKPGTKAYGAYTVKLSLYTQVSNRFSVGPQNFFPPPRVDSAVIRLDRVKPVNQDGQPLDQDTLYAAALMADAAFATRRKTILNSCKTHFALLGERGEVLQEHIHQILDEGGVGERVRGESLSREDFLRLGQIAARYL
ncbi:MAG: 16S rRNA (adenine(1518)-N(6)/adenine(1519)-N(6))-dimethyltransferase RsmA [Raoultibacter sp.]|jgi:16S rRNA (adenine1518-N6/adenine1519-N6)-dimethyltransferase